MLKNGQLGAKERSVTRVTDRNVIRTKEEDPDTCRYKGRSITHVTGRSVYRKLEEISSKKPK